MTRGAEFGPSSRHRGRLGYLLAISLIARTVDAQSAAGERRDVSGTIVDIDAAPVPNAMVTVACGGPATVTAADGSFRLTGVSTTDTVIEVVADGFSAKRVDVVDGATELLLQITVVRSAPVVHPPTRASGRMVREASGASIAGAMGRIRGTEFQTVTAIDGGFTLRDVEVDEVARDVAAASRPATSATVPGNKAAVVVTIADRVPSLVTMPAEHGSDLRTRSAPPGIARLPLRVTSPFADRPAPLYVLDGIVVSNLADLSGAYGLLLNQPIHQIAGLAVGGIDTIEVFDGASAIALYGAKAANGVVAITTKRGRTREVHAAVTQRFGFAQPAKKLGARRFGTIEEVRATFCGSGDSAKHCDLSSPLEVYLAANGKNYDHEAEILRTAYAMETVGTVSGGSDDARYYASVLYRDDPGVVVGTSSQKQSGRLALANKLGAHARVGLTANVIHSLIDRGSIYNDHTGTSLYEVLSNTPSFVDLQPKDGAYPYHPIFVGYPNAVQAANLLQNREDTWRELFDSTLTIDAYASTDGTNLVKLLGNLGVDRFARRNDMVSPSTLVEEMADRFPGTLIEASTTNFEWNTGAGVLWTLSPQRRNFRSALSVGVTYENTDLHTVEVTARGFIAGQPRVDRAQGVTTDEDRQQTAEFGLYAQEEIAMLDDRLLLVAGMLGERSSRNTRTDRYFLFPKLGAVYSLIAAGSGREALPLVDSLRVHAAYGEAGKPPGYGLKYTTPRPTLSPIGDAWGLNIHNIFFAPAIEPERQRELEIGLDLTTKDQRVVAELTGYQRSVSNLLIQRIAALETGFTSEFANDGGMRSRGLSAAVQVRPIATRQIEWASRGALTVNRSVITDRPDTVYVGNLRGVRFGAYRLEPGKSATQIVGGVGDDELAVVGNGEPDFRVSWSNSVSVGDFAFTAHIDWQHGSDIVNLMRMSYDLANNSADTEAAERRLEALSKGDIRPYVEDASFVKLREVAVSYALPALLATHLGPVKRLKLSLSGRNLWTFTRYSGLDPEVSNAGIQALGQLHDIAPTPPSRSYWISVTAEI